MLVKHRKREVRMARIRDFAFMEKRGRLLLGYYVCDFEICIQATLAEEDKSNL
jgi:hypothetical protein